MTVLVFDTAAPVVGVGVLTGDGRAQERVERVSRGAEARLLVLAAEALDAVGVGVQDLVGVGVTTGPGGFTGLRVGLATAAGLAAARSIPLWTASSLETRGARVADERELLVLLDARKQKVYAQRMVGGQGRQGPIDGPLDEALAWMSGPFFATGEGAVAYRAAIEEAGGRVVAEAAHPAVDVLARWTARGIAAGEGVDAQTVRPRYLRAPDARPSAKARPLAPGPDGGGSP